MTLLSLLPLATAVAPAPALAVSAHPPRPTVHASASAPRGYAYHGCFNETTGLPGTAGQRALYGGASLVRPGDMTVGACWAFCAGGGGEGGEGYVFAGLEYARECWCSQTLSSLSERVPDGECDLPCDGDSTQVCGGHMKLTVYRAGAAAARVTWAAGLAAAGAVLLPSLT